MLIRVYGMYKKIDSSSLMTRLALNSSRRSREHMQNPIRVGDALENGGRVTSGSPDMEFMDGRVARKGDSAMCDLHGETIIAEGHPFFTDKGIPVALHFHRCACGCRLISSLANASIA